MHPDGQILQRGRFASNHESVASLLREHTVARHRLLTAAISLSLLGACSSILGGCDAGGPGDADETASLPQSPRFPTAEAIVAHYNGIITASPSIDGRAELDLIYAENDLQRDYLAIAAHLLSWGELDDEMWSRFGRGLVADKDHSALAPARKRARITEESGPRAKAEYVANDGSLQTVYLVQIGDEWWISGYSLEYHPNFAGTIEDPAAFKRFAAALDSAATQVLSRVRRGEFSTFEEAQDAYAASLQSTTAPLFQ